MCRVLIYILALLDYGINLGSFLYIDIYINNIEPQILSQNGRLVHTLYVTFPLILLLKEIEAEVVYGKGCIALLLICVTSVVVYYGALSESRTLLIHFIVGGLHVGIYFRFYQLLRLLEYLYQSKRENEGGI